MFYLAAEKNVNTFEKIVAFLGKTAERPKPYGTFHVVSLIIILAACAVVILLRARITDKVIAYAMLISGIIMFVFEVYKQVVMSYNPVNDTWKYPWYIFPFQFCSTPIYLTFIAFVMYKIRKREAFKTLSAFLGTYSLIGAFTVLFVGTQSVLSNEIGINIQSMLHHGIMFVLAVMILSSGTVSFNVKTGVNTFKIFTILVVIAIFLNKIYGNGKEFDMFYLAPDSTFVYPVFNKFFGGKLPHIVYTIGYIVLFGSASSFIVYVGNLVKKIKK